MVQWVRIHLLGGDVGTIPGLGRFHLPQGSGAHTPQLPGPSAATAQVRALGARALQRAAHPGEARAPPGRAALSVKIC